MLGQVPYSYLDHLTSLRHFRRYEPQTAKDTAIANRIVADARNMGAMVGNSAVAVIQEPAVRPHKMQTSSTTSNGPRLL